MWIKIYATRHLRWLIGRNFHCVLYISASPNTPSCRTFFFFLSSSLPLPHRALFSSTASLYLLLQAVDLKSIPFAHKMSSKNALGTLGVGVEWRRLTRNYGCLPHVFRQCFSRCLDIDLCTHCTHYLLFWRQISIPLPIWIEWLRLGTQ